LQCKAAGSADRSVKPLVSNVIHLKPTIMAIEAI